MESNEYTDCPVSDPMECLNLPDAPAKSSFSTETKLTGRTVIHMGPLPIGPKRECLILGHVVSVKGISLQAFAPRHFQHRFDGQELRQKSKIGNFNLAG
jgi:hypothetical protein